MIINMATNDVETIIDKINECEFIFSSSLHGIIFAHAYGIPAIHIECNPLKSKDNFKFKDYYSVFKNIKYTKETVNSINFNKYLNSDWDLYRPDPEEVKEIQKKLLEVFPYKCNLSELNQK